jgi:hypothetical protein
MKETLMMAPESLKEGFKSRVMRCGASMEIGLDEVSGSHYEDGFGNEGAPDGFSDAGISEDLMEVEETGSRGYNAPVLVQEA